MLWGIENIYLSKEMDFGQAEIDEKHRRIGMELANPYRQLPNFTLRRSKVAHKRKR